MLHISPGILMTKENLPSSCQQARNLRAVSGKESVRHPFHCYLGYQIESSFNL